jgi:hypothetical protein
VRPPKILQKYRQSPCPRGHCRQSHVDRRRQSHPETAGAETAAKSGRIAFAIDLAAVELGALVFIGQKVIAASPR